MTVTNTQEKPTIPSTQNETAFTTYRPRAFGSLGLWCEGEWVLKAYGIHHDQQRIGKQLVNPGIANAARGHVRRLLPEAEREGHHHRAGFVILHQGVLSNWLLTHWWAYQNICCQLLSRSSIETPETFEIVTRPLMACVWELVVVDFERRAWVDTALGGDPGGRDGYLGVRLPDGLY